ncbi:MAG: ATP-binding protein [Fischerella sp.]|nr:ATP-binding protein [Fischerella sp.]
MAGLAQELNNPASAARRSAGQLRTTLENLKSLGLKLIEPHLTLAQQERLLELHRHGIERTATPNQFDPLAQTVREDELIDWLESFGIADGWKLAPTLVEAGLNAELLESIGIPRSGNTFAQVLTWLEATLAGTSLLNELDQSTIRISELIQAIKAYSFMDRALLQEVDIHEGLDNTLIILGHKLRKHSITVVREYALDLPRLPAHGSELNQVWTNLIDNAIDALGEEGTIWVRTSSEKDYVMVEIADNGPGIPAEIQSRIFEPFFTTKQVGLGTGLGLEIAHRIVVNQHGGDIRCFSRPGDTRFQVRLPIAPTLPRETQLTGKITR